MPPPIEYRPPNGEVVAVAFDLRGNVLVQSREPATLQILTQRVAPIVLSTERRADLGHRLFHASTPGGLACASCHPEGGEDGRVWQFSGIGARRTQSLRGGIMDTAPFHWNGDLPTLDHLMSDVFQGRMGGGQVAREQVRSLGRWLDQVPSIKPSSWHDGAAVARGRKVFESRPPASPATGAPTSPAGPASTSEPAACSRCRQLHNLAFRAPFLHDGCASTLADRFTKCGGGDKPRPHLPAPAEPRSKISIAYLESL